MRWPVNVHRCNEVQGGQQQVPYLQPSVRPPQMPRSANREIPYLSHLRTHHGQVTLVPPESAARVRKPSTGRSGRNPCVYDPPSPRGRRGTTQVPRPSVHAQLDGELYVFHKGDTVQPINLPCVSLQSTCPSQTSLPRRSRRQ